MVVKSLKSTSTPKEVYEVPPHKLKIIGQSLATWHGEENKIISKCHPIFCNDKVFGTKIRLRILKE